MPKTLALYVAYLHARMEYSSMRNYLAAVSAEHVRRNLTPPNLAHPVVHTAIEGARRLKHEFPFRKNAITLDVLRLLYTAAREVDYEFHEAFWAACLVAFFSLLRSSNLLACKRNARFLKVENVVFNALDARITVPTLKTSRCKGSLFSVPLPATKSLLFCPAYWIRRCIASGCLRGTDPVFSIRRGQDVIPLTPSRFTNILRRALISRGLEAQKFSLHSFRRGGATFAANAGVSVDAIKAQGNWRSDCYANYLSRNDNLHLEFNSKTAKLLEKSLDIR